MIKTTAPDGSYGPFHFNSMLVVKDGVVSIEPVGYDGKVATLVVAKSGDHTDASLEWADEEKKS